MKTQKTDKVSISFYGDDPKDEITFYPTSGLVVDSRLELGVVLERYMEVLQRKGLSRDYKHVVQLFKSVDQRKKCEPRLLEDIAFWFGDFLGKGESFENFVRKYVSRVPETL